ncbi:sperm flagellar 1 [Columba livia]|uniref:Sperm flagellar 1 n=1 Tax=Columba livia TaxID=8932 RepID=A0A2I0LHX3_COLLI|nr:sperm flagellar 1 [Columba livia]
MASAHGGHPAPPHGTGDVTDPGSTVLASMSHVPQAGTCWVLHSRAPGPPRAEGGGLGKLRHAARSQGAAAPSRRQRQINRPLAGRIPTLYPSHLAGDRAGTGFIGVPSISLSAVLAAEVVKFFFPAMVQLHSYVPASSTPQKLANWGHLNRKVLSKLNFSIPADMIREVVQCRPGTVEQVLLLLRQKIEEKQKQSKAVPGPGQILQLKVGRLEQLLHLKNVRIDDLSRRLRDAQGQLR